MAIRSNGARQGSRRAVRTTAMVGAVCLGLLTAACGSGSGSGSGSDGGTLTAYVYGDGAVKVQEAAVAEFNKTSKVKVKLVEVPGDSYQNKLNAVMSSPNAPDLLYNWGGGSIQPFVDAGELLDLTPYLTQDASFKSSFLPSVLAAGALDGKNYGIPMRGMQPVVLFYNKTLFAQNGLQAPTTWAALQTAITTLKAKNVIPVALGGADAWTDQMWLEELLDRIAGPSVFQKIAGGDSSAWGDPGVLKAAQTAKQLIDDGAFGKTFTATSYTNNAAPTLLGTGKAAMQLMGSWDYSNQLANHKDFATKDEGWVNFPTVNGGTGNAADVVGNPTNYWSVNAHTKNKDAAIAFLKSMAASDYANKLVANGDVPATTSAKDLLGSSPNPVFSKFQYDMVQQAPSFQLSWDQALPAKQATQMTTEIGKLFAGQVSPEQFVTDMKALK